VTGTPNPSPFHFTGRENDGTGLYYYRARYYDPTQGRFVSDDPIGLTPGPNMYLYVRGNPVRFRDPLGLMIVECGPCVYYAIMCIREGLECKQREEQRCREQEDRPPMPGELYKKCFHEGSSCRQMLESCMDCVTALPGHPLPPPGATPSGLIRGR